MTQYKITPWYNGLEQDCFILDEADLMAMGGYYTTPEMAIHVILNGGAAAYIRKVDGDPRDNYFITGFDTDYIC